MEVIEQFGETEREREGEGRVRIRAEGEVGMDLAKAVRGGKSDGERRWMRWATGKVAGVEIGTGRISFGTTANSERGEREKELVVLESGVHHLVVPLSFPVREEEQVRLEHAALDLEFTFPDPRYLGEWIQKVMEKRSFAVRVSVEQVAVKQEKEIGVLGNLIARFLGKGGVVVGDLGMDLFGVGTSSFFPPSSSSNIT